MTDEKYSKDFLEWAAIMAEDPGEDPIWPFDTYQDETPYEEGAKPPEYMELHYGDCMNMMENLPSGILDAVVTDPPYGMNIDGEEWDKDIPGVLVWREVLRLMKPGAIMLAACHAKTYHRLGTILELAGFEIIDMIYWHYNQSLPAGAKLDDDFRTLLKRNHEPWAVARAPFPTIEKPGKRPGKTKKETLGNIANFQLHGTGGLRVSNNGQGGQKWASNFIFSEPKPKTLERGLGVNPDVLRKGGSFVKDQTNNHRTVKPLGLMRRLVRYVAKPGHVVMDPFAGSGSTGVACVAEGVNFIGAEMRFESFDIMHQRIQFAMKNPSKVPNSD